jgi:predicted DNA-binding transcriptional regulator AlpA
MARAKNGVTDPRVQGREVAPRPDWDELVSPQELARRLDIPVTTIYGWRYKGVGPRGRRLGKHVRYWWSDVLEWLEDAGDVR